MLVINCTKLSKLPLFAVKPLLIYSLAIVLLAHCSWIAYADVEADDDTDDNADDENPMLIMSNINLCENVSNDVYLPYLGDCFKFYVCQNGSVKQGQCNDDSYLFDAGRQSCITPASHARCALNCTSVQGLSSFCYENTCTKYILCYNKRAVLRKCYDGLQYNSATDRCDYPQYVDCVQDLCPVTDNAENFVYIPSKTSCSKYYICLGGVPVNQTCENGLHFNTTCNCCTYPSDDEDSCKTEAVKRNIQPYSRKPPRRADIVCPDKGTYFYAHKTRQDAFYFCQQGRGVTMDCTPGLLYDPKLEECREPQYIENGIH